MDQRLAFDTITIAARIRGEIEAQTSDQEAVRDTLEGAVDLDQVIDWLLASIAHDEAMVEAIGKQVSDLNKRIKRLKERTVSHRALIHKALKEALWDARERPAATVSLGRKPACLGEIDETKIPAKFWLEGDPVLDKKALLAALLAKEKVPGAKLIDDAVVLSIRRT